MSVPYLVVELRNWQKPVSAAPV